MKELLTSIAEKIEGGERITSDEALQLADCDDLLALGTLAARANEGRNGARSL